MQAYRNFFFHYFNLKQTTGRKDYWLATFVNLIVALIFYAVSSFLFYLLGITDQFLILNLFVAFAMIIWLILATFFALAILIPMFTLSFRRYRDTGLSMWAFWIEPFLLIALLFLLTEEFSDGFTNIWAVWITGLLLVADILIKLLPTASQTDSE
nr:DUF805 domain-containing protein [Fructobacillus durionis]